MKTDLHDLSDALSRGDAGDIAAALGLPRATTTPAPVMSDPHAPVAGQPAAIVAVTRNGPYLARFPYIGGRSDLSIAGAIAWRDREAPTALVLDFTGRQVVSNIFNGEAR